MSDRPSARDAAWVITARVPTVIRSSPPPTSEPRAIRTMPKRASPARQSAVSARYRGSKTCSDIWAWGKSTVERGNIPRRSPPVPAVLDSVIVPTLSRPTARASPTGISHRTGIEALTNRPLDASRTGLEAGPVLVVLCIGQEDHPAPVADTVGAGDGPDGRPARAPARVRPQTCVGQLGQVSFCVASPIRHR